MNKKLPSVFVNVKDEPINNNMNLFYSRNSYDFKINNEEDTFINKLKINKKINDIFSSTHFVYKLPVLIKTEDGEFKTSIVSKTSDALLTFDNKKIEIDKIKDIKEI